MRNVKGKPLLYATLIISAVIWSIIAAIQTADLNSIASFVRTLPTVAFFDLLVWFAFRTWLWRWSLFRGWLVPFPDLSGTWHGLLHSTWRDPESGDRVAPIPAILTVRQTYDNVSCVMRTAEMVSRSVAEDFYIDEGNQVRVLVFSYSSNPRMTVSDRSKPHRGTAVLEIIEREPRKLKGDYWTDRKTTGEIELTYRCSELLEEMPDDLGAHPMAG